MPAGWIGNEKHRVVGIGRLEFERSALFSLPKDVGGTFAERLIGPLLGKAGADGGKFLPKCCGGVSGLKTDSRCTALDERIVAHAKTAVCNLPEIGELNPDVISIKRVIRDIYGALFAVGVIKIDTDFRVVEN